MATYNYIIEDWWKHLGCYDREEVSHIPYATWEGVEKDVQDYLIETDDWWNNLSYSQRAEVYNDFFDEC